MTNALQVPGATPAKVARLMLTRGRAVTRELDSTDDPIAVLVWSAGTHAVAQLSDVQVARAAADPTQAGVKASEAALEARLGLLDTTILRQRDLRLAVAEHDPRSFIAGLLGPPPGHAGGDTAWRRAAAAIVDYRDHAGLFDRDGGDPDRWERALGPPPADPRLAAHRHQARAVVVDGQAAMVLSELPCFVPVQPSRPDAEVATLASRPLGELTTEIAELRRRHRVAGEAPAGGVVPPPVDVDRLRQLEQAARCRLDRLTTELLTDPPDWLRHVVTTDLDHGQVCEPERYSRLARLVAEWSDTAGTSVRAESLDEVVGGPPADAGLVAAWESLTADLAPVPEPAVPERAADLGR
jgi:hypothetical protein